MGPNGYPASGLLQAGMCENSAFFREGGCGNRAFRVKSTFSALLRAAVGCLTVIVAGVVVVTVLLKIDVAAVENDAADIDLAIIEQGEGLAR